MKTIISIIAFVLVSITINAQDIIKLKNGTEIKGVVTEVGTTQVKFRKTAEGPVYIMERSDIQSITYENGTVEIFDQSSTSTSSTSTNNPNNNQQNNPKGRTSGKLGRYNADNEGYPDMKKHYGGPRIGATYIAPGIIADAFGTQCLSQFGWQFETRFFTVENGASGLFEFVPLLAGMERGKFLPSASMLIGFRSASGIEVGCGPNFSANSITGTSVGMVIAAGASFQMGNVVFPVNLAIQPSIEKVVPHYTMSPYGYPITDGNIKRMTGVRISLLVGFNARSK